MGSSNIEFDEGEVRVRWQTECWSAIAVICKAGVYIIILWVSGSRDRLGAEGIAASARLVNNDRYYLVLWCVGHVPLLVVNIGSAACTLQVY
jgi:hypothetical protein